MPSPLIQMSVDSKLLYERLQQTTVGETLTYAELSRIINRDVTNGARSCLMTARRRAMRLDNMVFSPVIRVGIKRLSDPEIVDASERDIRRLRRRARRAVEIITRVTFDKLPAEHQVKHNTAMCLFAVVGEVTAPNAAKRLEKAVQKAQKTLPLTKTIEALIGAPA